jgi:hypothetical protein
MYRSPGEGAGSGTWHRFTHFSQESRIKNLSKLTLDTYSHLTDGHRRAAAVQMDELYGS